MAKMNTCVLNNARNDYFSGFENIKAIYFDLDDTLCGYWNACKAGLRKTFEEDRPDGFSVEEMIHHWATAFRKFCPTLKKTDWYPIYLEHGEPTRTEQMRRTLQEINVVDDELAKKLSVMYGYHRNAALRLFPDVHETLVTLAQYYQLGVITNGPADIQREEIHTLSLKTYIQHVLIEGELKVGKPSAIVFETAEKLAKCSGEEILMVGNSYDHDILPAIQFGWKTAWVYRTSDIPPSSEKHTGPHRLSQSEPLPDMTIFSLKELIPFLIKKGNS